MFVPVKTAFGQLAPRQQWREFFRRLEYEMKAVFEFIKAAFNEEKREPINEQFWR